MQKLTSSQKKNCVAGAAKAAASIGPYLKFLKASTLIDLGIGVTGGLLNILFSSIGSAKKQALPYIPSTPKTKNVAEKNTIMNI